MEDFTMSNLEFKKICPYKFEKMFGDDYDKEFTDMTEKDFIDNMVFEVFPKGRNRMDFKDFLGELFKALPSDKSESLSEAESSFLENYSPLPDDDYEESWNSLDGSESARDLLYPWDDNNYRIKDNEKKDNTISELEFIRSCINSVGNYSFVENEGDKYSYSIKIGRNKKFEIRPCCPCCKTLLPDFWFSEEVVDYIPIGLVAKHSGGKTTYMTALLMNNFITLIRNIGVRNWAVCNAILDEKEKMKIQKVRYDNLNELSPEHLIGTTIETKFPNPTQHDGLPPVMFRIQNEKIYDSESHTNEMVIVSIFDSKGEIFEGTPSHETLEFLSYMYAYVYFIEASQIKKDSIGLQFKNEGEECEIITPEEQGELQSRSEAKEGIAVYDLLNTDSKDDAFDIMINIQNVVRSMKARKLYPALKHIAYTIIKSDELERIIDRIPDEEYSQFKQYLSQTSHTIDPFDPDVSDAKNYIIRKFIEEYFSEENERVDISDFFGNDVSHSCHCVSVARPIGGDRRCRVEPVRMADPLVGCLIPKFIELGWTQDEE